METAREVFRFSDTARAELEAILGSASARAVPLIEHYVAELHEPQRDADDGTRAARIREELGAIRAATASREALARALGNIGPDTARALLIAETLCHVEVRSGWDALSAARREDRLFAVVALVLAKHPAAPEALVSGLVQGIVNSRTEPALYAVASATADLVRIALERSATGRGRRTDDAREALARFVALSLRECGVKCTGYAQGDLARVLRVVFAGVGPTGRGEAVGPDTAHAWAVNASKFVRENPAR